MIHRKNSDHRELTQPRHDAGRRHLPLRRDQHDFIAGGHGQSARELDAEHDAEFAGLQRFELACNHVARQIGHLLFGLGNDPAHESAAHRAAARQQPLRRHVWRGCHDFGILLRFGGDALPVGKRIGGP
jgi:hypothetical protein